MQRREFFALAERQPWLSIRSVERYEVHIQRISFSVPLLHFVKGTPQESLLVLLAGPRTKRDIFRIELSWFLVAFESGWPWVPNLFRLVDLSFSIETAPLSPKNTIFLLLASWNFYPTPSRLSITLGA
ncbi:hypothetical protein MPNT_80071 [Candidatus Methylacidithermus pantelleriae]|uniref:Uncharacterized protein n=1 Tax=Candidatus Methylacidithermus pantelleriae TaxID=2744239 RepID=A0A8J2FTW9_9BACT|nr:hypothetical protein MPNT_80071 [Candidatus Methylacidithermus pantelleriae]